MTATAAPAVPMVQAEDVHKRFGHLEVLKGITLEVARGEVFCIVGPSGSGKSTFLRCINHLEKVDAGRLSVDGELVGYRQHGDKLYELKEREVAAKRERIVLQGDVPSPANPPAGCRFHPRCPLAEEICRHKVPRELNLDGHLVRCHVVEREYKGEAQTAAAK